jgi:glycosyltransferase involved in cell wall biosynthesis
MNLIVYVHDYTRQIGHSRAMIEVIDQLPVDKVKVVCYSHAPKEDINLERDIPYEFIKVPFSGIKPFLLRNLFFQIYTRLFKSKFTNESDHSISIGVCSFNADIINIQFAHFLWEKEYFKVNKMGLLKFVYKKILLRYLTLCEDLCYKKKGLKFVFLSKFIADQFIDRFSIEERNHVTAYSSADIAQFKPNVETSLEVKLKNLSNIHNELANLDISKTTFLFVGAFERKGLPLFVDLIPDDCNLIVVGQSESGSTFKLPQKENIFHVPFTKEIPLFYDLCDIFVFPTHFEPFGLVLLEATISGMEIITTFESVGASELLVDLPHISLVNANNLTKETFKGFNKLTDEKRQLNHEVRRQHLSKYTWKACAEEWKKIIE